MEKQICEVSATSQPWKKTNFMIQVCYVTSESFLYKLDGSLLANPVNDRRVANAVTLKCTFCLP